MTTTLACEIRIFRLIGFVDSERYGNPGRKLHPLKPRKNKDWKRFSQKHLNKVWLDLEIYCMLILKEPAAI